MKVVSVSGESVCHGPEVIFSSLSLSRSNSNLAKDDRVLVLHYYLLTPLLSYSYSSRPYRSCVAYLRLEDPE